MAELENIKKTDDGAEIGMSQAALEGDVNFNKSCDPIVVEAQQHTTKGIERTPCDCKSTSLTFGILLVVLITISVIAVILIYLDESRSGEASRVKVMADILPDTADE